MSAVPPEAMGAAIADALNGWTLEVQDAVNEAVQDTAKIVAKSLKAASPKMTGVYSKSWKVKVEKRNGEVIALVHNTKDGNLTSWLEHGHVSRNGTMRSFGQVKPVPHIAKAEADASDLLQQKIKLKVGG